MHHVTTSTINFSERTLTSGELRRQLGEVLERVHYQFVQFRILRKDKPMARLVNEKYMAAIETVIENDPALADTLSLLLNDSAMQIIEQGEKEWQAGERIPLAEALQ